MKSPIPEARMDAYVLAIAKGWYSVSTASVDALNTCSELTPRDVPELVQREIVKHAITLMALADQARVDVSAFLFVADEAGERIVTASMLKENQPPETLPEHPAP